MLTFYALIWYAIGVGGFVYWWTTEFDMTTAQVPLSMLIGFMGPLAWLMGWYIHGRREHYITPTTLFKKRK